MWPHYHSSTGRRPALADTDNRPVARAMRCGRCFDAQGCPGVSGTGGSPSRRCCAHRVGAVPASAHRRANGLPQTVARRPCSSGAAVSSSGRVHRLGADPWQRLRWRRPFPSAPGRGVRTGASVQCVRAAGAHPRAERAGGGYRSGRWAYNSGLCTRSDAAGHPLTAWTRGETPAASGGTAHRHGPGASPPTTGSSNTDHVDIAPPSSTRCGLGHSVPDPGRPRWPRRRRGLVFASAAHADPGRAAAGRGRPPCAGPRMPPPGKPVPHRLPAPADSLASSLAGQAALMSTRRAAQPPGGADIDCRVATGRRLERCGGHGARRHRLAVQSGRRVRPAALRTRAASFASGPTRCSGSCGTPPWRCEPRWPCRR